MWRERETLSPAAGAPFGGRRISSEEEAPQERRRQEGGRGGGGGRIEPEKVFEVKPWDTVQGLDVLRPCVGACGVGTGADRVLATGISCRTRVD